MLGFFKRPLVVAKSIITNDAGQILVMRRARHIPNPNSWDLPGGIVDPGEHPRDTATREAKEEAGLSVDLKLLDVGANTDFDHSVAIIYSAEAGGQAITLSHEHSGYKWVSKAEFDSLDISQKYKDAVKSLDRT